MNTMKQRRFSERSWQCGIVSFAVLDFALPVNADLIALEPIRDTTLYEYHPDDPSTSLNSNGSGDFFSAGRSLQRSQIRRGLLQFDFEPLPAGAILVEGTLSLELQVVEGELPHPDLELRLSSRPATRQTGEGEVDTACRHPAEFDGALGQSDLGEIDLHRFDIGIDTCTTEPHLAKSQAGRQEAPMQVTDFELGPVAGGRLFEPAPCQPASGFGFEDRPDGQPEEKEEGDRRQHGDRRASEMAVSHPPRSPHLSLRCST